MTPLKIERLTRKILQMGGFFEKSLLRKLMLFYVLIILIPVLLLGFYIYRQNSDYLKAKYTELADRMVDSGIDSVNKKISEYENFLQMVQTNVPLRNLLQPGYYSDAEKVIFINDYASSIFYEVRSLDKSIENIRVFITQQQVPETTGIFYDASRVEDTEWYRRFMKNLGFNDIGWDVRHTNFLFNIDKNYPGSKPVISGFLKLHSIDYWMTTGLLEIQINQQYIFGLLKSQDTGGSNPEVLLLGKEGSVIYNSFSEEKYAGGGKLPEILLKPEQLAGLGSRFADGYFIVSRSLDKLGCTVVYLFPVGEFTSKDSYNKYLIITILLTLVLFLGLISYLLTKAVFTKLRKLLYAVKQIQKGDLDYRLNIAVHDEVGELARHVNIMSGRIKELIDTVVRSKTAEKDAQLKALHAQIKPHFLYNTFEVIRMMAELREDYDVADAVSSLALIMRYNVSGTSGNFIRLKDEINYLDNYLKIQKLLFVDRADFIISVDRELQDMLEDYYILRLLVQPVVENAIKHGIKGLDMKGYVEIFIEGKDDGILVRVVNNGNVVSEADIRRMYGILEGGSGADQKSSNGTGVGLRNVQERLKLNFGGKFGVNVKNTVGNQTEVSLYLPVITCEMLDKGVSAIGNTGS